MVDKLRASRLEARLHAKAAPRTGQAIEARKAGGPAASPTRRSGVSVPKNVALDFFSAVNAGNTEGWKALLPHLSPKGFYGRAPVLHEGVRRGDLDVIQALLQRVDVNLQDAKGENALCGTIRNGNLAAFKCILGHDGFDPFRGFGRSGFLGRQEVDTAVVLIQQELDKLSRTPITTPRPAHSAGLAGSLPGPARDARPGSPEVQAKKQVLLEMLDLYRKTEQQQGAARGLAPAGEPAAAPALPADGAEGGGKEGEPVARREKP